ncbi:hypothetical protein [Turicibacter sanguinis]|uniref:hypothetical protein n=1 Tax=Turicibacter sanguinis TaxID=154288 RepID=UPI0018A93E0D|nr:hypothetical protein [Turicibacter sanguinis]MDB8553916.1 hypothetical protein [Turicibacter sanguinis]
MYLATLEVNGNKFTGTLDFHTLKTIQNYLVKINKEMTIPQIVESISKFDISVLVILIYHSINRITSLNEDEFMNEVMTDSTDEELLERYSKFFDYISELFRVCLPKIKESDDEFEDIPDSFADEDKDWDFSYMEYVWMSGLKRDHFWETTPKNFFEQIEIHRKLNTPKQEDVEEL